MTNWMTAAGLAFIAGGLATLISFRAVLFGGGARRPSARRRPETSRPAPTPRGTAKIARPARPAPPVKAMEIEGPAARPQPETRAGGLATIGLADDEDEDDDPDEVAPPDRVVSSDRVASNDRAVSSDRAMTDDRGEDEPWPPRRRRREPEPDGRAWARRDAESPLGYAGGYQDWEQPAPAGDYWTPVPDDLYSASAMSPLPPVPDYEPATGFDLPPIPANGPMPEWPPRRIRLPRSWAQRTEPEKPYVSRHSLEGN